MIEMTTEARELLDRYLNRARLSLRGTSVESEEVERDVLAHIDEALAGREVPVGRAELASVLERLGSPMQWVPEEEVPVWRRAVAALAYGPEDWRLAYLCLTLTLLGFITLPLGVGIILLAGAVFLSRAAIALAEETGDSLGARKWLVYPPLVFFAVLLMALPILLPVAGMAAFATETWPDESTVYAILFITDVATLVATIVAITGAWWIVLAGIAAMTGSMIRRIFVPVANGFRPFHAAWLGLAGVVLILGSGAVTMLI